MMIGINNSRLGIRETKLTYLKVYLCSLLFIIYLLTTTTMAISAEDKKTLTPVRVQLKWFHQYQFAGFYAALEKGYFQNAGLDVTLIEGGPSLNPTDVVTEGGAEFGVGNSTLLIDYNMGIPVVAVSAIFQHSPFVIVSRRDNDIQTVKDLEGHTLMVESHSAELTAYLKLAGVQLDKVEMVAHTGTAASLAKSDPSGIDASTSYITTEPYFASKANVPYQIFNPRSLNINFYAEMLFTSKDFATESPEIVISMRDALAKGWQYARTHQDELVSIILQKYHTQPELDHMALTFEAQAVHPLLGEDIIDIGYMSLSRWKQIGDTFSKAGELSPNYSLDDFLFKVDDPLPQWAFWALLVTSLIIVTGLLVTIYIVKLNRKLINSLGQVAERTHELEIVNQKLDELSNTDELTGVANRRRFNDVLNNEFLRAKRGNSPLALLLIDVDNFKHYNDYYGHIVGDNLLLKIARTMTDNAKRASDLAARFGGDEFALILPNMSQVKALEIAKQICADVEKQSIPHINSTFTKATTSIGVFSCIPEKKMLLEDFLKNADMALYSAKNAGRNCAQGFADSETS